MSWQDVRGFCEHRGDGPPPLLPPDGTKPGGRTIQKAPHGRFDVVEWDDPGCDLCGGSGGGPDPALACRPCNGTGLAGFLEPYTIACDLDESDARLLAFGGRLAGACGELVRAVTAGDAAAVREAHGRAALALWDLEARATA